MAILEYVTLHPKLILFGEYTILQGSDAITLPLKEFQARFDFIDNTSDYEAATDSNRQLQKFLNYIASHKSLSRYIQFKELANDISEGLYLQSNVPYGYGLGSSGLVCAAIIKTYAQSKKVIIEQPGEIKELKQMFAIMESYFHVQSSGIDPLACFLGVPLHFTGDDIKPLHNLTINNGNWFLVDSGVSRKTGELIRKYKLNMANHLYLQELEHNYIPVVNELITRILHSSSTDLKDWASTRSTLMLMELLSLFQMRYFRDMIPEHIIPLWQQGLDTGQFYLKLLGAGGGGYFLGYTQKPEIVNSYCNSNGFAVRYLQFK